MEQFYQQQAMEQVSKGILQVAEMEEKKLDAQLKNLENLGQAFNILLIFAYKYLPTVWVMLT